MFEVGRGVGGWEVTVSGDFGRNGDELVGGGTPGVSGSELGCNALRRADRSRYGALALPGEVGRELGLRTS